MKSSKIVQSVFLVSILLFVSYCWLLISWYEDMQIGRYEREPITTIIEIGIVLGYGYLAYRFIRARMTVIQSPTNIKKQEASQIRSLRHSYSLLRKMTSPVTTSQADTRAQRSK
ncbi:hypothetical protein [Spirosoma litoris]